MTSATLPSSLPLHHSTCFNSFCDLLFIFNTGCVKTVSRCTKSVQWEKSSLVKRWNLIKDPRKLRCWYSCTLSTITQKYAGIQITTCRRKCITERDLTPDWVVHLHLSLAGIKMANLTTWHYQPDQKPEENIQTQEGWNNRNEEKN
jgi:hypothetical protein